MSTQLIIVLTLFFLSSVSFSAEKVPQFKQYKVNKIYKGKNHPLVMDKFGRSYKTRLRAAIKEQKPSFAGKYLVTGWGCGTSGCNTGAIIDATTGQAYQWPVILFSVYPLKAEFEEKDEAGQEQLYRRNSRLMIFAGGIESGVDANATDDKNNYDVVKFYEFNNGKFTLLKTMPYGKGKEPSPEVK
ncbi:MAG: hypothetical protein KAG28_01440 [Cocleimonas sp.]|nr:hypothetical protein [Cocleimonas sp.]